MSWLEKIRNKPHREKIQLIWTVAVIAILLLLLIWFLTAKYTKQGSFDKTLFETIGRGFNDLKNNYNAPLPQK